MSFRDLPRLPFSMETELPTPKGFISSCEMMEALLAVRWQHDLTQLGIELNGHKVEAGRRLGNAAASGQLTDCASVIRSAGLNGELEAFVPIDPSNPDSAKLLRIGRADWAECGLPDWQGDLMRGHVFRFPDGPTAWANGKQLCFPEDQAENWLRGLRSPHLIPDPIKMDSSRLPERPYIFLSECLSWLANAPIRDGAGTFAWEVDLYSRAINYVEGNPPELPPDWTAGDDHCAFDRWFASGLAELVRRRRAAYVLRDALSTGDVVCRGRLQLDDDISGVQPVPIEVFQSTVDLKPGYDGIGMDRTIPFEERDKDAFLNGANWTHIRLARHDLTSLWGSENSSSGDPPLALSHARDRKSGRPRKQEAAREKYFIAFPNGHEARGFTWREAVDELIANHGMTSLSLATLKRAVSGHD